MICTKCGAEVKEGSKFCNKCGNPLSETTDIEVTVKEVPQMEYVEKYTGEERVFPILGQELHVSKELDSFLYYRKCFKKNARIQADITRQQYCNQVYGLDQFFDVFPHIYLENIKPLLTNAFDIILKYGVYDITGEDFANQHSEDFCYVNNTYKTMQEAFNNTLINNENRIHNRYASIPNIGFIGGIGTVLAVEAANLAISSSYQSSLRNVNVSIPQRQELYNRINFDMLMQQVYEDYWNVSYSLCFRLNTHDCGVWYPTAEGNSRAEGLMKNLQSGLIPISEQTNVILKVFENRPILGSLYGYLRRNYPGDQEIEDICKYVGY